MKIRNWEKHQHYKHRNPPWIKLDRNLLNDADYFALPAEAAKYLPLLWLLASEGTDGQLPCIEKIAFRLHMTKTQAELVLSNLSHWLVQDASDMLAPCKQDAPLETETETETETESKLEEEIEAETKRLLGPSGPDYQDMMRRAFCSYNQYARELGLPVARVLTPERKKKLRCRLEEHGLGGWFDALNAISLQPFLLGKNTNGWMLSFDFLLQPKSLNKVREKAYVGKKFSRFQEEGEELLDWARKKDKANELKAPTSNVIFLEPSAGGQGGIKPPDGSTKSERGGGLTLCASPPGVDES